MRRIIVTGPRDWNCSRVARMVLSGLLAKGGGPFVIVHGDCPTGVDRAFRDACEAMGIPHEPHPALWDVHGNRAGPVRNGEMVALGAEFVVACCNKPLAEARGTSDCCRQAMSEGIPVWLTDAEFRTRRLTREDLG